MFIELFMLVAVLKAGIAFFIPDLSKKIDPLAARQNDTMDLEEAARQTSMVQFDLPPLEAGSYEIFEMEPF